MDQRIPVVIQPLLQEYIYRLGVEMPGRISACYLVGSIALGAFNPRLSDIDFVAVLEGRAAQAEFAKILNVHKQLEIQHPQWKIEGLYFQAGDLGCADDVLQPYLSYHDGRLKWSERFVLSSVTWWILKQRGIALFGPPPETLAITVGMDDLVRKQRENLNSYWAGWTKRPGRRLALLSDWGVEWSVLGVLRLFYTIREHDITSKTGAGEYALRHVPERWHAIIQEALALREGTGESFYRSKLKRANEAASFLRYVIRTCNDEVGRLS